MFYKMFFRQFIMLLNIKLIFYRENIAWYLYLFVFLETC